MSRPKELNFFVAELNWELGAGVVREPLRPRRRRSAARPRRTTPTCRASRASPSGCASCSATRRGSIYMVRDPIERMLSHYLHNVGGGYETRPLEEALADPDSAYVARSRYAMQLEPYLEASTASGSLIVANEELAREREATMRRVFEFCGVDADFSSRAVRARVGDRQRQAGRAASGSWTARCGCPACGRSTATSTACPSRCAGWSSESSTTRARARRRSPSCPPSCARRLDGAARRRRRRARADRGPAVRLGRGRSLAPV